MTTSPRRPRAQDVNRDSAFRLSRVEAEGWNAAQRAMARDVAATDDARISKLNPHLADPERARWQAGFRNALSAR